MKLALVVLLAIAGLAVAIEIGLRVLFGFGKPPLYVADDTIGYRLAPNQQTRRLGNRIEINRYSMRSEDIAPTPNPDTLRVLLLGDSIANGGWWTDGNETISAILQRRLAPISPVVEVLNASANSWGPRNERAYLEKFGTFGARVVVLLINTDDLFASAPSSLKVGRDRSYPDRYPPLAWVEVLSRYVLPAPQFPEFENAAPEEKDIVGANLTAIEQIHERLLADNVEFLLVMTPLKRELGEPGSRDYEIQARQRLLQLTQTLQIPYIDFLSLFNQQDSIDSLYRDHIHLSPFGNELVTAAIERQIQENLNQ
ncbi:SGNH/GDSL hydrolase family protein [Baaleninema sp.]|uniref:SGNH/GDSL hydrolase family protein n=1 Tax=Baaleninema sp. TaxID=3101197 RepID=UPI003D00D651